VYANVPNSRPSRIGSTYRSTSSGRPVAAMTAGMSAYIDNSDAYSSSSAK
jgi:hypothetical protein